MIGVCAFSILSYFFSISHVLYCSIITTYAFFFLFSSSIEVSCLSGWWRAFRIELQAYPFFFFLLPHFSHSYIYIYIYIFAYCSFIFRSSF